MNHFTPVSEWQGKPAKRNALKRLLEDPVMQEAFATIRGISRLRVVGQITIESIAIRAAKIDGKFECLDTLEALTRKPEKQEEAEEANPLLTPDEIKKLTEENHEELP